MIRKIFFTVGMTLALLDSGAQMVTSTASTPTQLVNDVLLGGGITASTVTYTGANGSRGSFTGGSSIGFLFDEGIILTSGNVSSIPGWNTSGTTSDVTSTGADADLNALLSGGNSTGDKCVLEFDFVATSDSLNFKYIFASEEYPEFVCSDFNDVFAFFLSGPNPAGGNYVKKNIALIPGTNTFVGINTINGGVAGSSGNAANCDAIDPNWASYSGWYNDNPKNGNVIQIKPDGYTDIFTAAASLVCGETYHIKLAIADVGYMGDSYYDSYVFLEAKSFTSVGITSGAYTTDQSLNLTSDTNITEACNTGVLSFVLSTPSTGTTTINYTIGGTATNGVDYTDAGGNPLSGVITIPNGQDSGGVAILPVPDGVSEGDETITITFDIGSSCAGSTTQTLTYLLHDPNTVNINLSCGANDVNYVSFDWDAAPGASGYDLVYQVNTNPSQNASTTNTTYQVNGLSPGDSVHIVVTPVGVVCGGSAEITCFPGVCPADAGTVSVLVNGTNVTSPTYEYYLCQGDQLDLVSLNNYTNPPAAGPDPAGLGYGFYTQAPAGGDPASDAGFSGFIDYNANTSDQNTAGPSSPIYGTISASGSSFWIVPMTLDDKLDIAHGGADNGRGWDVNGDDCFDLGTPMKFTYLEDITASGVESCASSGQVEFTISGGAPQYVLGTNYSITNNGSGTLSSTTVANHNGTVTLTGLSNGDNYSIIITDSKGCTYTTVSGTFGACTCGASISGNATICEGDNTDLSVTLNGSGPWNVSVSDGSSSQNLVASSSPLLVNVNPTSTTTYTVSAMSDNGCSATASIAVNVFPLPAVSILADKTQECGSLTTVFASQNDANVVSWSWNFGDAGSGTANTSTQAGPTHSFDNSGSYSVSLTVIDANQCTQAITEQDFVTVHPFPNADFVADPETGIAGTNFHFVSSNTIAPANYTWIFGDGGSEGPVFDFYSDHVYEVDGDYIVSLQVSTPYGCLDTASVTVHVSSLKIPNVFTPNQDGYNDRFVIENADLSDGVTLLIYNRWGKKVYENSGYDNSWDGDNCSSGTYFYVVTVGTQSFNGPLTIIRD